jgi:hypothetical protein
MPLEEKMRTKAAGGELLDCSEGEGPFELAEMRAWGRERVVRAAVLRYLLIGNKWQVDAKGVRLRGLRISGDLDLEGVTLHWPLSLDNCYLDSGKPICLDHATAQRLTLTGCLLPGLSGVMLRAREVSLSDSTLSGALVMRDADITGELDCRGATLTGQDSGGDSLNARGIKVRSSLLLNRLTTAGAVRLASADITGQLNCTGATLTGQDSYGIALHAERIKVAGSVYLRNGFTAAAVRLRGAEITGQLSCSDAKLAGQDRSGTALSAESMTIGDHVFLDRGFTAAGTVQLSATRVGGSVALGPASLADDGKALDMRDAQITGNLRWKPDEQVVGKVDLQGSAVGQLEDYWSIGTPNGFWPVGGQLRLDGFTYGRFSGEHQATVEQRLEWIRSQYQGDNPAAFATQPYEQLASVYRRAGQDSHARKVAIARRADVRKYGNLNWYRRLGNWFLDWSIKYGYQSWRAGVGLITVFLIFWGLSFLAQHHHLIVPVGDIPELHFVPSATRCIRGYPCFYPFGYAVDTVIPIINVHQADMWGPDGSSSWGWVFAVATWIATGLGWALATLLVAGYTGLVRQD